MGCQLIAATLFYAYQRRSQTTRASALVPEAFPRAIDESVTPGARNVLIVSGISLMQMEKSVQEEQHGYTNKHDKRHPHARLAVDLGDEV